MVSLSRPQRHWYFPDPPEQIRVHAEVRTVKHVLVWIDPPAGVDQEPIRGVLKAWLRVQGGSWWAQVHIHRDGGQIGLTPGDWVRPWREGDGSPLDELRGQV